MSPWSIAFRQLLRRPLFAISAVFLLTVGIAANTSVFSLVSTIFLKPLPYPASDRLVYVFEANTSKKEPTSLLAPVRIEEWNRLNRTFVAISGYYTDSKTDHTGSRPERLRAFIVTPRYFAVYARPPILGRTFNKVEETYGGPNAAVLSYGFWTRRFSRAHNALGKRLRLGDDSYTIVGVMPEGFASPTVDVWLPAAFSPFLAQTRDSRFLTGIGRLKQRVLAEQARADLVRVQSQLGNEFPKTDRGWGAEVTGMKAMIIGDHGRFLWIALAAVGALLLLTCTNLAGLMLGHVYQRRSELAIRTSLGATRGQLTATILREVTLLVAAGIAMGTLASIWIISLAPKLLTTLPRISELRLDWRSLVFTAFIGALTVFLVGLVPGFQATRFAFTSGLSQGGRTETGNRHTVQQALLLGQFAITVVLVVSAGLLLRSYQRMSQFNAGFNSHHVLTFHVSAEWGEDRTAIGILQRELITTLENLPGVSAAGITNFLPTDEATLRYQYQVSGLGSSTDAAFTGGARTVSGGYLAALQIPILAGASCPDLPIGQKRQPQALINRSFAERFGQGQNLVGRSLHILGTDLKASYQIAGIVADVREDSVRTPAVPYVYTCSVAGGWPDPEYVVRVNGDPQAFASALAQAVHRIAPNRALFGIEPMQAHVDSAIEQPRLTAQAIAGFAAAAVLLATCGLYSLCMMLVNTRIREIGTRMALGARAIQVVVNLLSRAARVLAAGVIAGIALALIAGSLMRSVLFVVSASDPVTLLATCGLLFVVCLLAMLFPAIRAASIDPVQAIREQ